MPGTAPPYSINKGIHFASDYEKKKLTNKIKF